MQLLEYLFVPTILFLSIVAPLWIVMHYVSQRRSSKSLSQEERQSLDHMLETVDKMVDRIEALEAILDADHPDWKSPEQRRQRRAASDRADH
jgi:phage shock protein B